MKQLGPEPRISEDAGTTHHDERDPGHDIDLNNDGIVPGGSLLKADGRPVILTREGFDTGAVADDRRADPGVTRLRLRHREQGGARTLSQVQPLYQVAKIDLFTTPAPAELQFAAQQPASGAAELRDDTCDAWTSSGTIGVGCPVIAVTDIESGKVYLTRTSHVAG